MSTEVTSFLSLPTDLGGGGLGGVHRDWDDEDVEDVLVSDVAGVLFTEGDMEGTTMVSRGTDEGEEERTGITGALLDLNIPGLLLRTRSSGGEEASCRMLIFTDSLSSSTCIGSCSKSIFSKSDMVYTEEGREW